MEILSYPIGLLIGLFPIAVSLGPSKAPAHLLLDGRPVCELTERSPGCMVELGPDPRVHLLELLRTDAAGHVTERVRRWVNRPGIEPEVMAAGACDEAARRCDFDLTWAHPARLDPKRVVISLDGVAVWHGTERRASVALGANARPQILVADAEFPDGSRATYTRTLFAHFPEEAQAALQAVPVLAPAGSDEAVAATLRSAGWPIRDVEKTEPEITFVMQAAAFDAVDGFLGRIPSLPGTHERKIGAVTGSDLSVGVVVPNPSLSAYRVGASQLGRRFPVTVPPVGWSRYADAVAAAGYELGSSPRPRAVVLVLDRFDRPNASTFDARQARAYLSEVLVPLVVWRIGPSEVGPEWGEGRVIAHIDDLRSAFEELAAEIGRQRIAWLEGIRDLRFSSARVAPGVALAGRASALESPAPAAVALVPVESSGARPSALGPFGGEVHALVSSGDGSLVFAGTHAGVFRSRDGARTWESARSGLPAAPVRGLTLSEDARSLFAATDTGFFRSDDAGESWRGMAAYGGPSLPARVAVDRGHPARVYVGTRGGGVMRSEDGGLTFLRTLLGSGDVRALAVDPNNHAVWAATERGLYRSADRGATWITVTGVPGTVLALTADSRGRLFAATAGDGLFASSDGGASWRATRLERAYVTDVAVGERPGGPILAASPDGVFSSPDGGVSWKLARVGPIESLAVLGAEGWAAGGARGVLRAPAGGKGWSESNAGLAASAVFSLATWSRSGSESALVAGTARGLFGSGEHGAWKRLPGTPEGVEFYSVASASALRNSEGSTPDLLVGSSGEIGRSFGLEGSWSWLPAPAVFGFSVDPGRPGRAFAATRGAALRSEDGGLTWEASAEGLNRTFPFQLAVVPASPSTIYAATAGNGVYRSTNGGRAWKPHGVELSRTIVRCLVHVAGTPDRLYAGTDRGVFIMPAGEKVWSPLFGGVPRSPVYALLADPESPRTLFAGTGEGLFFTRDAGATWMPIGAGTVAAPVTSLVLDRARRQLYAGTLGAGVFAVGLPE